MLKKVIQLFIVFLAISQVQAQKQPVKKLSQTEKDKIIAQTKKDLAICIGTSKDNPGFGYNKEMPEGTELNLPPGIKIVKRKGHKFNPDISKLAGGTVGAFFVDVSFVYCPPDSTSGGIQNTPVINLPPGMMITSDIGEGQNGLLVENVYFTVPSYILDAPKDSACRDTMTIYIAVACMNEKRQNFGIDKLSDKDDNSDYTDAIGLYTIGKVTNDPNLQELLKVISNTPKLRIKKYPSRLSILARDREDLQEKGIKPYIESEEDKVRSKIQEAIWKVTDRRGITCGELEELKKTLSKYR